MKVIYDRGVFFPAAGLWLDPQTRREFAFVSHAHSDHLGAHGRILCTEATARLAHARRPMEGCVFDTLAYGEKREFDGWSAELVPAGHVLGSAQIYIEGEGGSLLYTGDFKRRAGRSAEPAAARHAETLVMETTYGRPRYRFPPTEESLAELRKFCIEALEEGRVPVLLGYTLGKAQEILCALAGSGLPVMLHGAVARIAAVYRECGVDFPEWVPWNAREARGHVVIAPPGAASQRALNAIRQRKVAALTGWALDPGAAHRLGVDAAIALSDHADYDELIEHVEAVRPRRVLTLHGFAADFARDLRARGIEAWALTGPDQLEWDAFAAPARKRPAAALPPPGGRGFDAFAQLCEDIRRATGRSRKIELLAAAFRRLDSRGLRSAAVWLTGRPFPPASGRVLHAGVRVIHEALSRASGVPVPEIRAMAREDNDTGKTATAVLATREGPRISRSLSEVAALFEAIAAAKSPDAKIEVLARALAAMHPVSGGCFVKILTGNLRIGLKEGLVEEAIAAAFGADPELVRSAAMTTGDLGAVAAMASANRLDEARLTLFQPARCMLASPAADAVAAWEKLGAAGPVWAEPKLDGLRAQAHCGGGRVEIFSRDLRRISEAFPEITAALRSLPCEAILDGEILAWDQGRALPFQRLQQRIGRKMPELFLPPEVPVACAIFDALLLDGQPLVHLPLITRRQKLESLAFQHPVFLVPVERVESPGALEAAFQRARSQGHEGLLLKDPSSPYQPGRRGASWMKLKQPLASLDVVVTRAQFGHGRRSKMLSDLTFAVRHGENLLPIGKAYSGLTDAEIEELTAHFLATAISRRGNTLEVEPSIVLEVVFDAIQPSDRHPSGLALRFPRIKRWRRDKSPAEIDTLEEAGRLASGSRKPGESIPAQASGGLPAQQAVGLAEDAGDAPGEG